ncbi:MAG: type VI secretion protein IcmF/TssM N-terminal domain-containing protein [Planctomycetota bacterium]
MSEHLNVRFSRWWSSTALGVKILVIGGLLAGFFVLSWLVLGSKTAAWGLVLILCVALLLFQLVKVWAKRSERSRGRGIGTVLGQRSKERGGGAGLDESAAEADVRQHLQQRWLHVSEILQERNYDFYSFPWYLIIGPAQSGKTTTIQKSDQEFPIGEKPVVDYGGTRGCNWFFTNQAILVDTAGRYVEHLGDQGDQWNSMLARDQEEWGEFLSLLYSMRSRTPVNGLILVVKVADLLVPDDTVRTQVATALRQALLDIEEKLRIRVPVYVLVTMCDKVSGFVDFFNNLPGLSDRTLFGWSRSGAFDSTMKENEFGPEFDKLVERLHRMQIGFFERQAARGLDTPEDLHAVDRMSAFPEEFATLGPNLTSLVGKVFAPSTFNEQHFLRGVYFTSGVQEGSPVLSACAELLGDQGDKLADEDIAELAGESKAYFIADLYQEKIFKEKGLAQQTSRARAEHTRKKVAYYGAAAVFGLAVTIWMAMAIMNVWKEAIGPKPALDASLEAAGKVRGLSALQIGGEGPGLLGALKDLATETDRLENRETSAPQIEKRIEKTVRNLRSAYRELYARHVFAELVKDLLSQLGEQRNFVTTKKDANRLGWLLAEMHDLGLQHSTLREKHELEPWTIHLSSRGEDDDSGEWKRVGRVTELLRRMKEVHLELTPGLDYHNAIALAKRFGESNDPIEPLAAVLLEDNRLEELERLANTHVLDGYWSATVELLTKDAVEPKLEAEFDESVKKAWYWHRAIYLDRQMRAEIAELRTVVGGIRGVNSLAGYRTDVQAKWAQHFERLADLKEELKQHDGEYRPNVPSEHAGLLEEHNADFLGHREAILIRFDEYPALKRRRAELTRGISDGLRKAADAANQPDAKNVDLEQIRRWAQPDTWDGVNAWNARIECELNDTQLFVANAQGGFWTLRDGVAVALDRAVPTEKPRDEDPPEFAKLLGSARLVKDNIGVWLRSHFYERFAGRFQSEEQRRAYIDTLEFEAGTTDADLKRYGADAANGVAQVLLQVLTQFQADQSANNSLWIGGEKAGAMCDALAASYFSAAMPEYWTRESVAGSHAATEHLAEKIAEKDWAAGYVEWHTNWARTKPLEPVFKRLESCSKQNEQPLAGSVDKLRKKLDDQANAKIGREFIKVLNLWAHYRDKTENKDSVRSCFNDLKTGLEELAKTPYERLRISLSNTVGLRDCAKSQKEMREARQKAQIDDPFVTLAGEYLSRVDQGLRKRRGVITLGSLQEIREKGATLNINGKFPFTSVDAKSPAKTCESDAAFEFLRFPKIEYLYQVGQAEKGEGGAQGEDTLVGDRYLEFFERCMAIRELFRTVDDKEKKRKVSVYFFDGGYSAEVVNWELLHRKRNEGRGKKIRGPFMDAFIESLWSPRDNYEFGLEPPNNDYRYKDPLGINGFHWTRLFSFAFGHKTVHPTQEAQDAAKERIAAIKQERAKVAGVGPSDAPMNIRWIEIPFRDNAFATKKGERLVLGIATIPPLPDELPDLERFGRELSVQERNTSEKNK